MKLFNFRKINRRQKNYRIDYVEYAPIENFHAYDYCLQILYMI